MGKVILILLIIVILYIAFTYLKGPRNTPANTDGFNVLPYSDTSPDVDSASDREVSSDADSAADITDSDTKND